MDLMLNPPLKLAYPKFKKHFTEFVGIGDNGHLWVEGCDTVELAQRFGTPLYVISEQQLRHNYRRFRDAWKKYYPGKVTILFANKSLNGLAIRHIMNQEGAGGDAFGINELYYSVLTGAPAHKTVLNGSNKHPDEIEMAIFNGICINIDAMDELDIIEEKAKKAGAKKVDLGIRVKLVLDPLKDRHGAPMHGEGSMQAQGASHKWGMTMDETCALVKRIKKNKVLNLIELHYHLSRMDNKASDFAVMAREMVQWTDQIAKKTGWVAPCVDIGGGWTYGAEGGIGPNRDDDETAATFEDYAREVSKAIKDECKKRKMRVPDLKIEPGRALSGPSGVALGTVGAVKRHPTKRWVNLDLSTNHIPWSHFCNWYFPIVAANKATAKPQETVDIVGPLCNSDEIGMARRMPKLGRGDVVAVLDTGGYQEACAAHFNAQFMPAMVLVYKDRAEVITERERLSDLMGRFRVPPRLLGMTYRNV